LPQTCLSVIQTFVEGCQILNNSFK